MVTQRQLQILRGTRAQYDPSTGLNISMDFNASPGGGARGTEVIIPDDASPEVRAAAEQFNRMVAEYAAAHGIADYPIRGVRTTSENQRGVSNTVHVEPFFNDDLEFQELIQKDPAAFARIYEEAFGNVNGRLIAPHGVGDDRGAVSPVFGDETTYGDLMAAALLGEELPEYSGVPLPPREGVPPVEQATEEPEEESWLTADINVTGNEFVDGLLTEGRDAGLDVAKEAAISALFGSGGSQMAPPPPPPTPMQAPPIPTTPVMFKIKRPKEKQNG